MKKVANSTTLINFVDLKIYYFKIFIKSKQILVQHLRHEGQFQIGKMLSEQNNEEIINEKFLQIGKIKEVKISFYNNKINIIYPIDY